MELYKSSQQEKLGLTVCYRTDEDEDQGIYVGEVKTGSSSLTSLRLVIHETNNSLASSYDGPLHFR